MQARAPVLRAVLLIYFVAAEFLAMFVVSDQRNAIALAASGIVALLVGMALKVDWRAPRRWQEFLRLVQPSLVPHSRGAAFRLTLLVVLAAGTAFGDGMVWNVSFYGIIVLVLVSLFLSSE